MKVTRVNELMCPRCGSGMTSGYRYPSCAKPPEGMTGDEAHRVFCTRFSDDLCNKCRTVEFGAA